MKCPPLSVIIIIAAITKSLTDLSFFHTQEVFFSSQSSSTTASQVCLISDCSPVFTMWHKWIKQYQGQREVGEGLEKKMGEVELSTYTLTEKPTLSLYTPLGIYLPDRNVVQLTLEQDQSPAFLLQPELQLFLTPSLPLCTPASRILLPLCQPWLLFLSTGLAACPDQPSLRPEADTARPQGQSSEAWSPWRCSSSSCA